MKKIFYCLIGLLAVFSILRARAEEREHNRLTVHPSLIELNQEDSGLSIGFGLLEEDGEKEKVWNVLPLRVVLRSGKQRFYLALNALSFLTRSGINFGGQMVLKNIHRGDVISVGGPVSIIGRVEGNVWVFGADIQLKAGSEVTGDVVAIGGAIEAQRGSRIRGNKQSLPQVTIPFLGLLTSPQSVETLQFIIDLFGILLFLMVLFLVLHFKQAGLASMSGIVSQNWRGSLLYLFLGIIVIPILFALLVASVIGIFILPVILVGIVCLTYFAFLGISVRLGRIFMKGEAEGASRLYLQGLLGFFVIRLPSLLGRFLSLLTSEAFNVVGGFLKLVGTVILALFMLYSFGSGLVFLRTAHSE